MIKRFVSFHWHDINVVNWGCGVKRQYWPKRQDVLYPANLERFRASTRWYM